MGLLDRCAHLPNGECAFPCSTLLIGQAGVGKSTVLREMCRVLSDTYQQRVVVVDTRNDLGGFGTVPHPSRTSAVGTPQPFAVRVLLGRGKARTRRKNSKTRASSPSWIFCFYEEILRAWRTSGSGQPVVYLRIRGGWSRKRPEGGLTSRDRCSTSHCLKSRTTGASCLSHGEPFRACYLLKQA